MLLAISGDSHFSHAEFAKARGFPFPLLSDIHRATIRAYGVLDEDRNVAYRSTFVIDREGALRWGAGSGASHLISGHSRAHATLTSAPHGLRATPASGFAGPSRCVGQM